MSTQSFARIFVRALELTCIYIASRQGRLMIKAAKEPPVDAATIVWCDRADFAEAIVQDARASLKGGIDNPERAVLRAAERYGVTLKTAAELQASAELAVARVEAQFRTMLRDGKLRDLNSRYREYRLARAREGKRAQSYAAWLYQQRLAIVLEAARAVASSKKAAARIVELTAAAS